MNERPLLHKNIVIVGASSGIGKATALTLAKAGANLVLAARRELLLEEIALQCQKYGVKAYYFKTDVTKLDQVRNLFEFALDELDSIDIWINNSGVGSVGSFTQTPMEVHEQVIRTNLLGHMHGAYVIMPYFKERKRGNLINNISIGGFVPNPYAVAYSASKFGLRGYAEALRYELQEFKGIHICDIFPAFIDTPGFQHGANYTGKEIKPVPPIYDPYKVAGAMLSVCIEPKVKTIVGNSGRLATIIHSIAPNLLGFAMAKLMKSYFKKAANAQISEGNLFKPSWRGAGTHGGWNLKGLGKK